MTLTATTERENRRLTFSGTAAQQVNLRINNDTSPVNHVTILKPDGSVLITRGTDAAAAKVIDTTLTVTGTYTIVTELWANADSATLTLDQGTSAITGTITADGAPVVVNIPAARQKARLTFSGNAGQRVSLRMTNVTMTAGVVDILDPNGSALEFNESDFDSYYQRYIGTSGVYTESFGVVMLPVTGTYTVLVSPTNDYTGNVTLRLYDVPADISATIQTDGPPVNITTSAPGQNATLVFSGVTGQPVKIRVANNTVGKVTIQVIKPWASPLWWQNLTYYLTSESTFEIPVQILHSPGNYSIFIDPWEGNKGSVSVSIATP